MHKANCSKISIFSKIINYFLLILGNEMKGVCERTCNQNLEWKEDKTRTTRFCKMTKPTLWGWTVARCQGLLGKDVRIRAQHFASLVTYDLASPVFHSGSWIYRSGIIKRLNNSLLLWYLSQVTWPACMAEDNKIYTKVSMSRAPRAATAGCKFAEKSARISDRAKQPFKMYILT